VADLWPLEATQGSWDEDTFYGLIEVFHDLVARPRGRTWHDYSGCGWHYSDFAIGVARNLYRWRINRLLSRSTTPLRLAEANGNGIEMAEVIPGFAAQFDMEHVLAAIAPRPFFAVSATADKYSADAEELVELAMPAFDAVGARGALSHLRVEGGHALDARRFDAIVEWLTAAASETPSP